MGALRRLLMSSIGKKYVMGLSGLLLIGFVATHLAGNLLIFQGSAAYNDYAAKLHSLGPLLWIAEVGLLVLFGLHVLYAYWLVMENRASRGDEGYEIGYRSKQRTTYLNLAPRSWMAISGTVVLVFLVWHLIDMRFGLRDDVDPTFERYVDDHLEDESGRPLFLRYERAVQILSTPISAGLYTVGAILLGFHLSHGASSWFRSVGLEVYGLGGPLKKLGVVLAVVIALGFASIPIYVWFADIDLSDLSAAEARERARIVSEEATGESVQEMPAEDVAPEAD
ncbi:succinate dehydrogenase cytochrome b subunit [Alienimonas sp. DA493]|uniref:succinate dehydrogenase cytochrome b subunit n=1 Tax=Alienimonas sp. DA493 TaxID=3373605 RepID=UPI0037546423